ncbi:MAG: type II secretion system F family protein, partial [Chromatiaceae bacterium]
MARFLYKAVKQDGETLEGELDAVDEAAVIRQLQSQGLIPIRARLAGGWRGQLRRAQPRHRQ